MLAWLSQIMTSGTVSVFRDLTKVLQVTAHDHVITIDIQDQQFLKQLLPRPDGADSIRHAFHHMRTIAQALKAQNVTVTIAYQGDPILRLGQDAKPRMTQLITGTYAIEVSNILRLFQLLR